MKSTRKMALLSIATSIVTLALKFGAYWLTDSVSLLSDALEAIVNLAAGLVALGALTSPINPPTTATRTVTTRPSIFPAASRAC